MKKKFLMLLTLFAGVVTTTADNTVSAGTALIPQGKTGTFSIELTNTDAFASSMELHLTLPEGITFEGVSLSDRFTDNPSIGKTVSGQEMTITTLSTTNAAITGNSGPLFFITVSAAADIEAGTRLTASVTKMELAMKVGSGHEKWNPEPFDFEIEITDKVVLDENSPVVPGATDEAVDILVKRTIKAGQWSTICLPFDMTEEQVYAAFGDDVQLAEFDTDEGYTVNDDGTIVVNFIDTDLSEGLYGNWPYIIKTSGDVSEFEVNAQIAPSEDDAVAEYTTGKGKNKKTVGTFTGTLHAGTVIPAESLFLSDNKFYYSVGKTVCKAFRAFFWLEDVLDDLQSAGSRIALQFDGGTTTAIWDNKHETINNERETVNNERCYDLQGRRLSDSNESAEIHKVSPYRKDVYIVNGKKIIK